MGSTKKNFGKAIEGMQMTLESETKAKVVALRMKKKLETDVADLETALEHANNANMESQKTIKGIQLRLREDFASWRMGDHTFYGPGDNFKVNTKKPMTVVTQFFTNDNSSDGELIEIRRLYVQEGNVIS